MRRGQATFAGDGGVEIFWRSWLPEGDPARGVVVVVHGLGEHSARYEWVAERLVAARFAVYALDHRGHGRSAGPRALIDRLDHAVADVDRLVGLAAGAHPEARVFMLAHSMGGTIGVRYALAHQDRLAGLVLSGPLAAIEAPAAVRLVGRALSVVAPRLGLIELDAGQVSRDPAVVAAYREDPLVHHGRVPARTLAELVAAIDAFPGRAPDIRLPTLIAYGTADALAPPAGSVMLGQRIGAGDLTVRPYEGLYHEILNEPERERVMEDIVEWLLARSAPRPGG